MMMNIVLITMIIEEKDRDLNDNCNCNLYCNMIKNIYCLTCACSYDGGTSVDNVVIGAVDVITTPDDDDDGCC